MNPMRVMTVVGTRPELIRLSRVIDRLERSPAIDHVLVHTGQNYDYELNQVFFEELRIPRPDHYLEAARDTATSTIAEVISRIEPLLRERAPDAFLVLGDTNSCLAAIPARKHRIPIFHMEAGNRCFDLRVPEETNRRLVDHIADVNLPYSAIARDYLLREGLPPDRVITTGSPMFEVLAHHADDIATSDVCDRLSVDPGRFTVVSTHREENVSYPDRLDRVVTILNRIAERFDEPVVFSCHPRTRKAMEEAGSDLDDRIRVLKPLGFFDYSRLQQQARVVVSDSGTISEEASILGFAALNLRDAHERPEAMEEAAVMMVGLNPDRVDQALSVLAEKERERPPGRLVRDYDAPDVSEKVLRIILSYTDYVRRVNWGEN
ncbi:MAG TPA: UDP-N-acetylglucosamine 2-epimerase (non-hydrolyzing) [Longimicrobiales bacterium]|nr:UDP-N-acetylglucosamine 2-epimerase (non-hydrolyzing) [Longimicrobiales bacterium]